MLTAGEYFMPSTRRNFIAAAAAPMFVPHSAFGANDRLVYGVIATGGRGRYLNRNFQKLGYQCGAVCDVYEPHLAEAKKDSPDAKTYADYRKLLEDKSLDAVVIASPDHHHSPMLLESLSAGKDVYAEKPLSHSLMESEKMIKAVKKSDRIVQVGMQRRSAESILKAKKLVDDGILGRVTMVRPQWHWNIAKPLDNSPLEGKLDWDMFLGPAPKRSLEPMRFRRWRYFYDYAGGNMTDQGTHLMDVVQWFMKSGPPKSALAHGYVANMQGAEHPDVFSAIFEYPDFMATWTLNYDNAYLNGWSITFQGDKATMILDEAGYQVFTEPWKRGATPSMQENAPVPIESHIANFAECVKSRKQPNCPVEIAAQAVAGPHLANIAMLRHRRVSLGPDGITTESGD
jgi:predicted dehydrogenase